MVASPRITVLPDVKNIYTLKNLRFKQLTMCTSQQPSPPKYCQRQCVHHSSHYHQNTVKDSAYITADITIKILSKTVRTSQQALPSKYCQRQCVHHSRHYHQNTVKDSAYITAAITTKILSNSSHCWNSRLSTFPGIW